MKSAPVIEPLYPRTVFIGSQKLLAAWNACGRRTNQVISTPFIDLTCVIELIAEVQPDVVVVEQALASQRAGAALMDRLHNERYTSGTEIRLLSPAGAGP